MKSLYHYLAEGSKNYSLRIQITKELDKNSLSDLSDYMTRYQIVEIKKPKRIPITRQIDTGTFNPNLYEIDVTTRLPINSWLLANKLTEILSLTLNDIKVWVDGEPLSTQQQHDIALDNIGRQAQEKELISTSLLSTDSNYEDFEQDKKPPAYGDSYNNILLQYLKQIADERQAKTKNTIPLFGWLDNLADTKSIPKHDDFNAEFNGVKPIYSIGKNVKPPEPRVSRFGNYDDQVRDSISRKFTDKKGKSVVVTQKLDHIRKESK
jgi:hypothetical protein